MRYEYPCEICEGPKKALAKTTVNCGGCGARRRACKGCSFIWVACSEECRAKWRAEAAKGLPVEKLVGPAKAKARKPKGYDVYQKELS